MSRLWIASVLICPFILFSSCADNSSGGGKDGNVDTQSDASLNDFEVVYEIDGQINGTATRPSKVVAYRLVSLDTSKVYSGKKLYTLFSDSLKDLQDQRGEMEAVLETDDSCARRVEVAEKLALIPLFGVVLTDLRDTIAYYGTNNYESVGYGWAPPSSADIPNAVYVSYSGCL